MDEIRFLYCQGGRQFVPELQRGSIQIKLRDLKLAMSKVGTASRVGACRQAHSRPHPSQLIAGPERRS